MWRGPKKVVSKTIQPKKIVVNKARKLTPKNELLLTMRLGLLNEDLADRSQISVGTCSETFKTWIKILSGTIGNLVQCIPKESVQKKHAKYFSES